MNRLKQHKVKLSENNYVDLIFKTHTNKNEYLLTKDNLWIRNFGKINCIPKDINSLYSREEIDILIENEVNNKKPSHIDFFSETITIKKILIISDGFNYENKKYWIDYLGNDVKIICVHGALRFWNNERLPDYYVFTNPFDNSMIFYPDKYFPFIIASSRSNYKFLSSYQNNKFIYNSTPDEYYESPFSHNSPKYVDEYRNAIAAAISLAYNMNAEKICLAYPIDAYKENRAGTTKFDNSFVYPQQMMSANIIDAMCFWYKFNKKNTKISYTGIENLLKFSTYLKEEDIIRFFNE